MKDLTNYRKNYQNNTLLDEQLDPNPFVQFSKWFDEIDTPEYRRILEPNAMTLSSVDQHLQPRSSIVLLKKIDEEGFVFFTNYHSEKARNISKNNKVSVSFFWYALERQVHIYGQAQKTSPEESDQYFATRPQESQIAACISPQSQPITREELYERYENLKTAVASRTESLSRPETWGGYRIIPYGFEYWQGGGARLHDRILYTKQKEGVWFRERLAP